MKKKKLKQIQVNTELPTKIHIYPLLEQFVIFLHPPPPKCYYLIVSKGMWVGVEFWVFLFWPYQNLTIASNKKRMRKSLTNIIAFEQGGQDLPIIS